MGSDFKVGSLSVPALSATLKVQGPAFALGQTLEAVVRAVDAQNGVTFSAGAFRFTATTDAGLGVGDRVKLKVVADGTPLVLKLVSVNPASPAGAPSAEALLPLLSRPELPPADQARLRDSLAQQADRAEAQQLRALLAPLPLGRLTEQLSAALARQVAESGLFLESKLKRGAAASDVKALALKLLDGTERESDPALRQALEQLLQSVESRQARSLLALGEAGQVIVPLTVQAGEQEGEADLQFCFEAAEGQPRLTRLGLALDLSGLGRVCAVLTLGQGRALAVEINAEDAGRAALIAGALGELRESLTEAGFQVIGVSAQEGPAGLSDQPGLGGGAPHPMVIDERA